MSAMTCTNVGTDLDVLDALDFDAREIVRLSVWVQTTGAVGWILAVDDAGNVLDILLCACENCGEHKFPSLAAVTGWLYRTGWRRVTKWAPTPGIMPGEGDIFCADWNAPA